MRRVDPRRGGSLVYVVVLMTIFAILSTGFLYLTSYNLESSVKNREYIEAQTTARMIHQTFCQAVSDGTSSAMERIWEQFEEDCREIMDEAGWMSSEQLLRRLEKLEYVSEGHGGEGDLSVKIRLTARPGMGQTAVRTRVSRHGYTFTMNADILFDDPEGETLEIEVPVRGDDDDEEDSGPEFEDGTSVRPGQGSDPEPEILEFYTRGRGVLRYYGDD